MSRRMQRPTWSNSLGDVRGSPSNCRSTETCPPAADQASRHRSQSHRQRNPSLRTSQFVRRSVPAIHGLTGTLCPNMLVDKTIRFDEIAPDQTVVVTMTPPRDGQRREMTRRGAHVLVVEKSSTLGTWLRSGRSCAAIVRPDRTVLASSRSLSSLHTRVPMLPVPVGAARPA
ncbi:MAG: 3-(3-hydroxy-phenyl)propionate hydroxylase [Rhodococcus erythropolis]|jgi:3-(3-hydroxy-phenyl)propionate hydroxylase|nr:3-(3-hydroxy-phenyl)propionate hydroxylase [Rhodococcus erythropolis]